MRRTLALLALLPLLACGSKHVSITGELRYGKTPEENYKAGLDEVRRNNNPEAVKFFEYVRTKFPFSMYAALSELRLADIKFDEERYLEAADAYAQFVQLRPSHDEVDYARYRIGESYFRDAPGDFALFPPSHEKDLRQVERAGEALREFIAARPDSKYAPDAKRILAKVDARLAAHEWYVAEYYFKRGRWAGAAGRYQALVEKYPGSANEAEALMKLAQACLELDEKHRARTALQRLIVKHPEDPRRPEAERLLASLR